MVRTDHGTDFTGRAIQTWAARNPVERRFVQPSMAVQNADIKSRNSRFRDECLSHRWFVSRSDMHSVIDSWREDYSY